MYSVAERFFITTVPKPGFGYTAFGMTARTSDARSAYSFRFGVMVRQPRMLLLRIMRLLIA